MKVLITGGTGAVGKAVVERLVKRGWEALVIGRRAGFDIPGAEYAVCDIGHYDDLLENMQGCDMVVHLAAIANPMRVPGQELFSVNVAGTYNVFEAAAQTGIKRVVQASSINSFGCFWGNTDITPQYLPIDEAHPTYTTDAYSFSKNVIESIGDYYWRREGISSLALRLPGVWPAERFTNPEFLANQRKTQALIDAFAGQSEAAQKERLAAIRQATQAYREQKHMEYPQAQNGFKAGDSFSDDPLWSVYAFARFNFWAYVDERDSAQSIDKGLSADYEGSHILFINAANNSLDYDSQTLARLFFPETTTWTTSLAGTETLVSIAKARELIGFEPEYAITV